jgi:uncharacterized protein YjiS (DUF1127 family)
MTYYIDRSLETQIPRPSIIARINTALELHKQRKALCSLTKEQLDDIGLTRRDVLKECAKSFWVNPTR